MHYTRNTHAYAITQEQIHQDEAVLAFGERSIFVLWWSIYDFRAGVVDRCPVCFDDPDGIAATYGQPTTSRCADCYGTTFEGGVRAILYRPALWSTSSGPEGPQKRGIITAGSATIQTVSTFTMRDGDMIVRGDGTRWRADGAQFSEFVTGYAFEGDTPKVMRSNLQVTLMDQSSVGELLAVDMAPLAEAGWNPSVSISSHPADLIVGEVDVETQGRP